MNKQELMNLVKVLNKTSLPRKKNLSDGFDPIELSETDYGLLAYVHDTRANLRSSTDTTIIVQPHIPLAGDGAEVNRESIVILPGVLREDTKILLVALAYLNALIEFEVDAVASLNWSDRLRFRKYLKPFGGQISNVIHVDLFKLLVETAGEIEDSCMVLQTHNRNYPHELVEIINNLLETNLSERVKYNLYREKLEEYRSLNK